MRSVSIRSNFSLCQARLQSNWSAQTAHSLLSHFLARKMLTGCGVGPMHVYTLSSMIADDDLVEGSSLSSPAYFPLLATIDEQVTMIPLDDDEADSENKDDSKTVRSRAAASPSSTSKPSATAKLFKSFTAQQRSFIITISSISSNQPCTFNLFETIVEQGQLRIIPKITSKLPTVANFVNIELVLADQIYLILVDSKQRLHKFVISDTIKMIDIQTTQHKSVFGAAEIPSKFIHCVFAQIPHHLVSKAWRVSHLDISRLHLLSQQCCFNRISIIVCWRSVQLAPLPDRNDCSSLHRDSCSSAPFASISRYSDQPHVFGSRHQCC